MNTSEKIIKDIQNNLPFVTMSELTAGETLKYKAQSFSCYSHEDSSVHLLLILDTPSLVQIGSAADVAELTWRLGCTHKAIFDKIRHLCNTAMIEKVLQMHLHSTGITDGTYSFERFVDSVLFSGTLECQIARYELKDVLNRPMLLTNEEDVRLLDGPLQFFRNLGTGTISKESFQMAVGIVKYLACHLPANNPVQLLNEKVNNMVPFFDSLNQDQSW